MKEEETRLMPGNSMFVPKGKIVKVWVNNLGGQPSEVCITISTKNRKQGILIWVAR